MTFDRDGYEAQFRAAEKHLKRGEVISHCIWRHGHLTATGSPRLRQDRTEAEPPSPRGVMQGQLL